MSSRSYTQTFPFRPKPKQRPRLGKRGRIFTPTETIDFENLVRDTYAGPLFDSPVSVQVSFDTDEFTLTVTELGDIKRPKHVRADLDNLMKAVLDGLQSKGDHSGAWDNDSIVLSLSAAVSTAESRKAA